MLTRKDQIELELEAWKLRLADKRTSIAEYTVPTGRLSVSDAHLIAWLQQSLADLEYIMQCIHGLGDELAAIKAAKTAAEVEALRRERDERARIPRHDRNPIAEGD